MLIVIIGVIVLLLVLRENNRFNDQRDASVPKQSESTYRTTRIERPESRGPVEPHEVKRPKVGKRKIYVMIVIAIGLSYILISPVYWRYRCSAWFERVKGSPSSDIFMYANNAESQFVALCVATENEELASILMKLTDRMTSIKTTGLNSEDVADIVERSESNIMEQLEKVKEYVLRF